MLQISLVCIEEELEAWLIADGRALSTVLSREAHPVKIKDEKKPERRRNPKAYLKKIFKQCGYEYSELVHTKKIVEALPNLTKIKHCTTFVRFAVKVTGRKP